MAKKNVFVAILNTQGVNWDIRVFKNSDDAEKCLRDFLELPDEVSIDEYYEARIGYWPEKTGIPTPPEWFDTEKCDSTIWEVPIE